MHLLPHIMSCLQSCFLCSNSANGKYGFLGSETESYSSRVQGLRRVMLNVQIALSALLFHNSVCDLPTLPCFNSNRCSCLWSCTAKEASAQLDSSGWEPWWGSEQGSWFGAAWRRADVQAAPSPWRGLGSLCRPGHCGFCSGRCAGPSVKQQAREPAWSNTQALQGILAGGDSVSSVMFFLEARCSGLGGLPAARRALVPGSSLGSHEYTWKDEWKRPGWYNKQIFTPSFLS